MSEQKVWKQERPDWCKHQDCIFMRRVMDSFCGGKLPEAMEHCGDFNTHRLCLKEEVFGITDYMVNASDLNWLRWVFDALDGRQTSFEGTKKVGG